MTANPQAHFGIIYAGHSFMLVECRECSSGPAMLWQSALMLVLDDYTDGQRILLISLIYSVFDEKCETVYAPGGATSILTCMVAFVCHKLQGFEIDPPLPPPLNLPLAVPEGDEERDSGEDTDKRNDYLSHNIHSLSDLRHSIQTMGSSIRATWTPDTNTFSLGLPFDGFGIAERVLDASVRRMLFR